MITLLAIGNLEIILIVLLLVLFLGGGLGYSRRSEWGSGPVSLVSLLLVIVLVVLLFRIL